MTMLYRVLFAIILFETSFSSSATNNNNNNGAGTCNARDGSCAESCVDVVSNCGHYKDHGDCIKNEPWMRVNCPVTCGFCTASNGETNSGGAAAAESSSSSCVDVISHCAHYKDHGDCIKNEPWMRVNCPETCGFCTANRKDTKSDGDAAAESSSSDCVDAIGNCAEAKSQGDCINNEHWMRILCQETCGFCNSPDKGTEQECTDFHPKCELWTRIGECVINPGYMLRTCRESCWGCVNVEKLREKGVDEEEIRRRQVYANTDFGLFQEVDGLEIETTKAALREMDMYARNNVTKMDTAVIANCQNNHGLCAFWAGMEQCEAGSQPFMMNTCSLACRTCEHTVQFQKCYDAEEDPSSKPTLEAGGIYGLLQTIQAGRRALAKYKPQVVVAAKDQDDPWVVRFDNFLSDKECDILMELASTIGWQPSPPDGQQDVTRTTQSAYCSGTAGDTCEKSKTYGNLLGRIATLTGAPTSHIAPMEFVKYRYTDYYGVHHDFRIHDSWKPAGPRILSVFLCLSDVEEGGGGAMGFPELDWLSIKPKKGQALLWPNVLSTAPMKRNKAMVSEGLPVVKGTKYGAHVWIHMYNYKDAQERGCV